MAQNEIEDKLLDNWINDEQQTFGERFVERFPSRHKDSKRASEQERGLTWLIDNLVPQSGSDVVLAAGSIFAGGPIGRVFGKAAKPVISKWYASILGSGKVKKSDLNTYIRRIFARDYGYKTYIADHSFKSNMKAIDEIRQQSPSMKKLKLTTNKDRSRVFFDEKEMDEAIEGLMKEAKDAYKYYYSK